MNINVYRSKPFIFKVKKVLRYLELYGLKRTFAKVICQFHLDRTDSFDGFRWNNTSIKNYSASKMTVGIVGCGSFAFSTIAYYLNDAEKGIIRAAMDIDSARARSLASYYKLSYATTDAHEILSDPAIDLVYIASNHSTHAEYAIKALDAGKNVHIEKPHVVSYKQLHALVAAIKRNHTRKVFLGFNRPKSKLFLLLKNELKKEEGPIMINWFIAGHKIEDDHWYFKSEEGGRLLGNLCHWTDLTLEIIGIKNAFPCRILPLSSKGAKSDFSTSIEFADGSIASITFSAKGHTFEGVREVLNLHKGDLLAELKDFKSLSIVKNDFRKKYSSKFRDHGHKENIINSYVKSKSNDTDQYETVSHHHLIASAELFLSIKKAHDKQSQITITNDIIRSYR